jgi:DNA-directed RNA polymerase specialized sigma24 family protein
MGVDAGPKVSQIAEAVVLDEDRRGRLVGYACARFGISREDAEDLLQETALELLRCRSHVRNPDGFVFKVFKVRCARYVGSRIGHR